jgi:hypothetical protein
MPNKTSRTTKTIKVTFTRDEIKEALIFTYKKQFTEISLLDEQETELTRLKRTSTGDEFTEKEFSIKDFELLQISYTVVK